MSVSQMSLCPVPQLRLQPAALCMIASIMTDRIVWRGIGPDVKEGKNQMERRAEGRRVGKKRGLKQTGWSDVKGSNEG